MSFSKLFTFQYGATSTAKVTIIKPDISDLHSNMVLLLQGELQMKNILENNLHSNMVLLLRHNSL